MGDASTILSRADARHLLRRSGFGALPDEVANIVGLPRGVAVDDLLNFRPSRFFLRGDDLGGLLRWWIQYMIRRRGLRPFTDAPLRLRYSRHGLQEKLVVFWHDHFASTLGHAPATSQQNLLFRRHCVGNFKEFIKAINKNPLMMTFLGTDRNLSFEPNENYARELMELFTLGPSDFAGNPNYSQADIVQIARAFTGWSVRVPELVAFMYPERHDFTDQYPERGRKVIFRSRGGFRSSGRSFAERREDEGEAEIDAVTDILFAHRDSDDKNTVARFLTRKLFQYFAHAHPDTATVDQIVAASGFDLSFDLRHLLRALFVHDAFYASAATAAAAVPKSVKWPVDYVIGTLRTLRMEGQSRYQFIPGSADGRNLQSIAGLITAMGQSLLRPPSVFGWDWEEAWLTTGRMLARFNFAMSIASSRGYGRTHLNLATLVDPHLSAAGDIVDAVTDLLGIAEQLTAVDRQALVDYLGGPLDLTDATVARTKLAGLFNLALVSPAFQLH